MTLRPAARLDLHGFLVVKGALSAAELAAINAAADACWDASYTDGDGHVEPCRRAGHQSNCFFELRGTRRRGPQSHSDAA